MERIETLLPKEQNYFSNVLYSVVPFNSNLLSPISYVASDRKYIYSLVGQKKSWEIWV